MSSARSESQARRNCRRGDFTQGHDGWYPANIWTAAIRQLSGGTGRDAHAHKWHTLTRGGIHYTSAAMSEIGSEADDICSRQLLAVSHPRLAPVDEALFYVGRDGTITNTD
jgi:hypothetical protein